MAAKIFRINYKSDFILTLNSDAGWMTPFCIKFYSGAPSQAYFVGWDGETYTHCSFDPSEPTKLVVQFDDHHLPIGELKYQVAYHFTVADFPNDTEDEVLNPANITTEIDGDTYQVMLDFTGETAPEIQFSLPAYANEAQRIANEQARIAAEQQRIANEDARIQAEETRQYNEQQRIQHEEQRVSEFATLKSQSQAATRDANDAATLANQKAQLAQDKAALADDAATLAIQKAQLAADKAALANDAAQLAADKAALAQQKAEYAQQQGSYAKDQGDYAKNQGDYAKAQGDTAQADHERAEADHGTAVDDHTQAGNDHTRAESDHGIAVDDHTQAGNDHTRAESDHGIAVDDHTQAGNDHTRAESDHGIAVDDHTQAGNDHTRAESDHTRAESDHAAVEVYVDSLGAFDISSYHATGGVLAKYADLTAALGTNGANIPEGIRKGGMSVKFVQSYDNKYVQYFLTKDSWNADANEWEKINLEDELEQLNEKIGDYSKESTYNSSSYSGVRYKAASSSVVAADSSINGYIVPLTIGNKYTFYGQWYSLRTYSSRPTAGMTGGTQIDVSNTPNRTVVHTAVEGENYALVTVGTTYQDLKVTEEVSGLTERVEALEGHLNDDVPGSKVLNVADITSDFVLGYWNVNNGVGNSAVWTTSTSLHTVTKPIRKGQVYKSNTQLATSSAVSHALLDDTNKIIKLLTTANVNSGYTITDTDITSGATKIEICYRDTAQTVAIYCECKEYLKDQLEGIEKSVDDTNTRIDNVVSNETIEFQKRAKYFVHYKTAGEIDVFVKGYDGTHDLEVRFMNGNINHLFDFFDWRIFENDTDIVKHDETGNKTILNGGTGTDYISGYAVKAVNNADGDLTTLVPTGGWHGYNGATTNVTKTARKLWSKVFADGRELGIGESAFCNTVVLKWANRVQAANTEKEDGTGREVLEELITVVFDGNKSIVTKEITALEDIRIQHHYGLNAYNGGLSKVVFVTDTTIGSRSNDLVSEDDKCRELRFIGSSHEFLLHIDDFGEGTYKHSNRSYSGQYVGATNKGYFGCPYIEGTENDWLLVPQNGCIFFRGYIDCHPLT